MKQGSNRDWTDAVREKALSGATVPSPVSWEAVGRRMRRAAALRRTVLSAVVVLPLLVLLVWAPWRKEEMTPPQPVARSLPAGIPDQVGDDRGMVGDDSGMVGDDTRVIVEDRGPAPVRLAEIPDQVGDDSGMDGDDKGQAGEDEQQVPRDEPEPFVWPENPGKAARPRIAIGLRAGAGTVRRTGDIALQSAPYIAALTYLNAWDTMVAPGVKSNYANTLSYAAEANILYPNAVNNYTHDLPLTLGLSVRLDLTPRLAVESGLEYTYLHSVEESVAGRLDQRLHFIGIPLRMETTLWTWDRLGFYAGIGGKVEKCVSASLGTVLCEESRLQWSAEAFGGIQYRIGSRAQLYFQPELSYYFTRTDLITYRTEHPLGLSLHAGLRFDL